ncbi:MAG: hypothetical protein M3R35_08630 [Candidatus Eremiobacteraeota bacterium]|nr:hypothetical protein [Candidatus Eremiobacteraeota bacterium]
MNDAFFDLPLRAQQLVRDIEAKLGEAEGLLGGTNDASEAAFSLRETRSTYLPKTLEAFAAIPRSKRTAADDSGRNAEDHLLEQLSILERATSRSLEALATQKRSDLAVNARFLAERFDDRSTEISEAPSSDASRAEVPATLTAWLPPDTQDAKAIVAHVGRRFQRALPAITAFQYGGLWGTGAAEAVTITLQQGAGTAFRYSLSAKNGILEPSVTKLVHGTSIQTVNCPVGDWMRSLYDDLNEQARHHAQTRSALARLMQ